MEWQGVEVKLRRAFVNISDEYDDAFIWDGEALLYKPIKNDNIYELKVRATGPAPLAEHNTIIYFRNSHDNIGVRMGDEWLILRTDNSIWYMLDEYRIDRDFSFDGTIVSAPNSSGI
jgi:hypothetical protein